MPMLSDKRSKQCRATAYRLLRHALIDSEAVKRLDQNLDWYIVKLVLFHGTHCCSPLNCLRLSQGR